MPIIVTNNFPPSHGGVQTMLFNLAQNLHDLGEDIAVVAPDQFGAREFDQTCKFKVFRYKAWPKPLYIFTMMSEYVRVRRAVKNDVTIVSGWWPPGLAVALLPKFLRARYFVLTHGMELGASSSWLRTTMLNYVYRNSSGAIYNSSYTANLAAAIGLDIPGTVIPPGVNAEVVTPDNAINPTILAVGRLVERKGFDITLKAVARLLGEFPTLRYEIIGDGPQLQSLTSLAERLSIQDRVIFHGKASDDLLKKAYARAWCFALPVRRIGGDVEGFGIVYLEAAMAELATIGGRDSGAIDAIEDGKSGILVDGTNADEVVAALRRLLSDREYAKQLGQYGRNRAIASFNWLGIAEKTKQLLGD